jgi:hypothetical protein
MSAVDDRNQVRGWLLVLASLTLFGGSAAGQAAALETREFAVAAFHRVHFLGEGSVRLTQGDSPRLVVRGNPAALAALRVEGRDGDLRIDARDAGDGLELSLQVAGLEAFTSSGAGRIVGDDLHFDTLLLRGNGAGSFGMQRLQAGQLEVQSNGATRFDLAGQVGKQVISLRGSGAYEAGDLVSDRVSVKVTGASEVHLWAEELLDVVVAGSARINYAGSPRVEQRVFGQARIVRIPRILI